MLLDGGIAIVIGLIYPIVRCNINRGFPAQVADRLLTHKGNAFVGNDVLFLLTYEGAINTLDS